VRKALKHVTRHARIIRVDHVMGMHRLYWVPRGMDASSGAYVNYPAEEMYALLALESSRSGTAVVGEDLGTVPEYVGPTMQRHNLYRMYASYFNIQPDAQPPLRSPGPDMFAYVDTHDMATFAGYLTGADIQDRFSLGMLSPADMQLEMDNRRQHVSAMRRQLQDEGLLHGQDGSHEDLLRALLTWLSMSDAAMVIVNLEDLWLEKRPQNTPGTSTERPNWRGRSRHTLQEIRRLLEESIG
jgi:4-alpha-glucanotransferase